MAHLIDFSNNRANIAYTGKTPWHGLGVNVDHNTTIDQWRIEAGLNWEARKAQAQFIGLDGGVYPTDSQIVFRSDTHAQLGVVTDRYQIVQPAEILEFYRDLVGVEGWHLDVVGSLDGGKRIWALAKTGHDFGVNGTIDKVGMYLLLATSFDGKMATIGKFTSVRVVCQNTLTASLGDNLARVSVGHNTVFNADKVKQQLGLVDGATIQLQEESQRLAQRKVTDKEALIFIKNIIVGKDVEIDELSTRSANLVKGVFDLYKGNGKGSTLTSAQGTAWGVLSAITEHVDHYAGRNNNNRVRNAWFGQGENLKLTAKNELLLLAA